MLSSIRSVRSRAPRSASSPRFSWAVRRSSSARRPFSVKRPSIALARAARFGGRGLLGLGQLSPNAVQLLREVVGVAFAVRQQTSQALDLGAARGLHVAQPLLGVGAQLLLGVLALHGMAKLALAGAARVCAGHCSAGSDARLAASSSASRRRSCSASPSCSCRLAT